MRLLTTWTKFHSQIQQCQHSVTKREPVKTANGGTMFPNAKQPAAREAAQLTIRAIAKLQRSGLSVSQAPETPQPRAGCTGIVGSVAYPEEGTVSST